MQAEHPAAAAKLRPHVETMRGMALEDLHRLAYQVEAITDPAYKAIVGSCQGYADMEEDTLLHGRAFLRHYFKCTPLFSGDGFATDAAGNRGACEVLMPRAKISDLPLPSTGEPSPQFCISDDVGKLVEEYIQWTNSRP